MKGRRILCWLLSVSLFSGCVTGSKKTESPLNAPPPAKGQGRIWIYSPERKWHEDEFGIQINYATVGTLRQGHIFYVDKPPGNYLVESILIGRTRCRAILEQGESVYVRMTPVHVRTIPFIPLSSKGYMLEVVPEYTALSESKRCVLGDANPAPAKLPAGAEDPLIQGLHSSNASKVVECLGELEKKYPTDTNSWSQIKVLLRDPQVRVRRKAARVLGIMHAEVNEKDIEDICAMLKSNERGEPIDALKSLRGLNASAAVPRILPLLKDSNPAVVRDACRTLAVLGDESIIASIKPLLEHPDRGVKADAYDAIFQLKGKPPAQPARTK